MPDRFVHIENVGDPIFASIGTALSLWARCEDSVFDIYKAATRQPDVVAAIPYFSLGSIDRRLKLVDATIRQFVIDPEMVTRWDLTSKIFDKMRVERNHIAHNAVTFLFDEPGDVQSFAGHAAQIANSHEARFGRNKPMKPYAREEVDNLCDDIRLINLHLARFAILLHPEFSAMPGIWPLSELDALRTKYFPHRQS